MCFRFGETGSSQDLVVSCVLVTTVGHNQSINVPNILFVSSICRGVSVSVKYHDVSSFRYHKWYPVSGFTRQLRRQCGTFLCYLYI